MYGFYITTIGSFVISVSIDITIAIDIYIMVAIAISISIVVTIGVVVNIGFNLWLQGTDKFFLFPNLSTEARVG